MMGKSWVNALVTRLPSTGSKSDPWNTTKSKEEAKLVRKLDFFILTYSCFSYFFNQLDRSAFANAYVAGLKESLDLKGSNYNVLLSMATLGLLVGQFPSSLIIQKVPPRIFLPTTVIVWAALTMAGAACKNFSQLCAVRFLMGFAEASTYPVCVYVIGSWYKPSELTKRIAIFTVAGQVGVMFAGAMMAAIYTSMEGLGGLRGWQWVFIIDGIITLPVAFYGYMYHPDLPESTRASYLSQAERKLALSRLPPKRKDGHNIEWRSLLKRVFKQPTVYILFLFSLLTGAVQAVPVQSLFLLYLKFHQNTLGYTQAQVNSIPIAAHVFGILSEFGAAYAIDALNSQVGVGIVVCALQVLVGALLLAPNVAHSGRFVAFFVSASAYSVNPLMYGWANVIATRGGDDAARAVILAAITSASFVLWTFWGIVFYRADDAPTWRNGSIVLICAAVAVVGWLFVVRWLDGWSARKYPGFLAPAGESDMESVEDADEVAAKSSSKDAPQPTHSPKTAEKPS